MAEIWNLNALCRCCHKDGYFRSMRYPYVGKDGQVEVYNSWMRDIFGITMVTPSVSASEMVCEDCITSLRDARTFKKQVVECEMRFQQYCTNETVVKIEPETDESNDRIIQDFKNEEIKVNIKIENYNDICVNDNDNTDHFDNTDIAINDDTDSDSRPLANKEMDKEVEGKVRNIRTFKSNANRKTITKRDSKISKCKTTKAVGTSTLTKKKTSKNETVTKEQDIETNTEEKPWPCKLCKATTKNIIDLQNHMAKKHKPRVAGFNDVKCQFCDDVVKGLHRYKQHVKAKHPDKGTVCNFCPEVYVYRVHMREHYEKCHLNCGKYTCDTCDKTFYSKALIRNHVKLHEPRVRKYMCSICSNQYLSSYQLNQHVLQVHHDVRAHRCRLCPKNFKQKKTLRLHMRAKHTFERPYACDICDKRFIQRYEVTRHRLTHTAQYVEGRKGKQMVVKVHNNDGTTDEKLVKIYRCFLCKEGIGGRKAYRKHLEQDHGGMLPYQCHVCPRSFASKYVLERHIYTHGNTEVKCEKCSKVFKHETLLVAHRKRSCYATKPLLNKAGYTKCDMCNLSVKDLEKHKTVHLNRPFKCELCEKDFTHNNALQRHIKEVHLKVYNHSCDICSMKFIKKSTVVKHKAKKHPDESPMKCEVDT